MRYGTTAAALACALSIAGSAWAQAAQVGTAVGEVRRIDLDANKVTVAHDAIEGLNMRAMTMVMQAPERALIEKLAVGDKVKFTVARNGGAFTLQAIEVEK